MFDIMDSLFSSKPRPRIEVHEHEPPAQLVAGKDILRIDGIGRTVLACAAGMPPSPWLRLSDEERAGLVPPKPRPPTGFLVPGRGGFTPEGVSVGFTIEPGGTW
jgi:hypothetical protein